MTDDRLELWNDLIRKAARFAAYDIPNVSEEDLFQDLWVYVLEHGQNLDPERSGISTILSRKAKSMALDQRKKDLYTSVQYTYRTSDVREILEDIYEYESWAEGFCPADAKSADGLGSIDVRSDVSWALKQLPDQYFTAIELRYASGVTHGPDSRGRRQLNRAIKRLTDILNSYYRSSAMLGHPGKRKAISNAQARAILEDQDGQ